MAIMVWMEWNEFAAAPYEIENGGPVLRPVVGNWINKLAKKVYSGLPVPGSLFVVDIAFFFPEAGHYDPESFLPIILQAVEMGSGWSREQMIPFCRDDSTSAALARQAGRQWNEPGFLISLYPVSLGGHGLTGRFDTCEGQPVIILDRMFPAGWSGMGVVVKVGVIQCQPQ